MDLTRNYPKLHTGKRLLIVTTCAVIALATCASALALRMNLTPAQTAASPDKKIRVDQNSLKVTTKVPPIYPPAAKKAGVQGIVVLAVIIGKDGVPEIITVQTGPRELQQSAIDAVRQWRWEPYLLNGGPVEIETTLNITYSLEG